MNKMTHKWGYYNSKEVLLIEESTEANIKTIV